MLNCWAFKSEHRPSFETLHGQLNGILEKYKKMSTIHSAQMAETNQDLDFSNFISNIDLKKQMDAQDLMLKRVPAVTLKTPAAGKELQEKRFSESDDSQYFSGTDISNSLLYVDSSTVSSSASSHYSPYTVPSSIVPSLLTTKYPQAPPSPPPPKPLQTIMSLASAAHKL
jgi:hypothetical protein